MKWMKYTACAVALSFATAGLAEAKDFVLKIQTHLSAESLNGKNAAQFAKDVETMSGRSEERRVGKECR